MKKQNEFLLVIDGFINLALGILLLLVPVGTAELLGVPRSNLDFYPTILGSILFGIGLALLVERFGQQWHIRGLGLGGAIVINFCGATSLLVWLLTGSLDLSLRGLVLLWAIVVLVYGIGFVEIISKFRRYE
ncbi:MAG: hypothetical protein ACK2T7_00170 [Anaerolineales bacterium]|jgi:hypothetical protein